MRSSGQRGDHNPPSQRRQALQPSLPPLSRGGRAKAHGDLDSRSRRTHPRIAFGWPVHHDCRYHWRSPELNSNFQWIVRESHKLGRHVIDRCNLTVLFEPGQERLAEFLAQHGVEIIASLPCYTAENVDQQRGRGVFEKSIHALQRLNGLGYGAPGSNLMLNLVYNPLGASLPPPQEKLEADYKKHLYERFGIQFHRLFTLANMPIKRFAAFLNQSGKYESYTGLLVNHFNSTTVPKLMCRSLVSVGWDGKLYDCDFNQMLDIEMGESGKSLTIWDLDSFTGLTGKRIATGSHCFGCTAGAGSGCG